MHQALKFPAVLLLRRDRLLESLLEGAELAPGALVDLLQGPAGLEEVVAELDHLLLDLGPERE